MRDEELERIIQEKIRKMLKQAQKPVIDHTIDVDEQKLAELVKKERIVLIDFWAEWCGPCKLMDPVMEQLAREYAGKVVIAKVNVDVNRTLASKMNIMAIPTYILFKDGTPVNRLTGAVGYKTLKALINKYISEED